MHPGQKLRPGARVVFEGVARRFTARCSSGASTAAASIRLWTEDGGSVDDAIEAIGHVPLPPYIKRDDRADDRERYQTVFARERGSVAAPTAGLHFTPALNAALAARGVDIVEITLHVGYGTFQPVRVDRVEDHRLEAEHYDDFRRPRRRPSTSAEERSRRIVAVGTTTTRTLEAAAAGRRRPCRRRTRARRISSSIPGFAFRVVDGLLTNFHLPRSSLLHAGVGVRRRASRVLAAYAAAIAGGYRFYSYGDAMLVT